MKFPARLSLGTVLFLALVLRGILALTFIHDPTGTGGREVNLELTYAPYDAKFHMWGRDNVLQPGGVYAPLDHAGNHFAYGPVLAYALAAWSWVFGPSILSLKVLIILGDIVVLAALFQILRSVTTDDRQALRGALLYSVAAFPLLFAGVRAKEDILAAGTMLAAVVALRSPRPWGALAAGFVAALSFAVKPTIAFILPPLGLYLLVRHGFQRLVVFTTTFLIAASLMLLPEYLRSGVFPYSTLQEHVATSQGLSFFGLVRLLGAVNLGFPGKALCARVSAGIEALPVVEALLILLYLALFACLLRRTRGAPEELLLKGSALALLLAASVKRVVYGQYLYWAFPFLLLIWAKDGKRTSGARIALSTVLTTSALAWFALTSEKDSILWQPSLSNAPFILLLAAGAILLMPGRAGLAMGAMLAGIFLFRMGQVDLLDAWLGLKGNYLTVFANRLLPVLLCNASVAVLVFDLVSGKDKDEGNSERSDRA